jgi:hypothetical protein
MYFDCTDRKQKKIGKLLHPLKSYEDYMDFFFLEHITGYTLYELAGDSIHPQKTPSGWVVKFLIYTL